MANIKYKNCNFTEKTKIKSDDHYEVYHDEHYLYKINKIIKGGRSINEKENYFGFGCGYRCGFCLLCVCGLRCGVCRKHRLADE